MADLRNIPSVYIQEVPESASAPVPTFESGQEPVEASSQSPAQEQWPMHGQWPVQSQWPAQDQWVEPAQWTAREPELLQESESMSEPAQDQVEVLTQSSAQDVASGVARESWEGTDSAPSQADDVNRAVPRPMLGYVDRKEATAHRRKKRQEKTQRIKDAVSAKTPDRFKNPSGLQVRFRTGVVYVSISLILIMINSFTTMILASVTAGICAAEFYYMLRADAKLPNEIIGIVAAVLFPFSAYFWGLRGLAVVTFLFIFALTIWYVFWQRARIPDVGVSVFGAFYTGFQLSALVLIRMALPNLEGGLVLVILFFSIWANDAFAYLVGSRIGRHKLAPRTSPNKSWEGFAAGLVASMGFWCLMVLVPGVAIDIYQALLFGLVCGLTSVLGDLCESRIKRGAGFKDSGHIMPGHGGLFDRCDSLMPTATMAAILLFGGQCLAFIF